MTPEELKSVDTSALVQELKRRMSEIEQARQELGFGSSTVSPVRGRPSVKTAKIGRNPSMSAAAEERWRGWDAYKKAHPNAKPKEFFKAKRAGKA
jgi:hypothetical protein